MQVYAFLVQLIYKVYIELGKAEIARGLKSFMSCAYFLILVAESW